MKTIHANNSPAGFLEMPQVGVLLKEIITPATAQNIILRIFGGLRHGEASTVTSQAIDAQFHGDWLSVATSGHGRQRMRLVPASPALRAWLAPYGQCAGVSLPTPKWPTRSVNN